MTRTSTYKSVLTDGDIHTIDRYQDHLNELREFGGYSEERLRFAFQNCLDVYCRAHKERLVLVPDWPYRQG